VLAAQRGGQQVQGHGVEVAGDDRDDAGITLTTWPRRRTPGRPRRFRIGGAVQAAQLIQRHVQQDLGGLAGAVWQAPGGDQPPARFLQPVMITLPPAPDVFGAGFLA
jgi:hypothetical protein